MAAKHAREDDNKSEYMRFMNNDSKTKRNHPSQTKAKREKHKDQPQPLASQTQ